MQIQFLNTIESGESATEELVVDVNGERHVVRPGDGGVADVSEDVGRYLLDSDLYAVEEAAESEPDDGADGGGETSESSEESEPESGSGSGSGSESAEGERGGENSGGE